MFKNPQIALFSDWRFFSAVAVLLVSASACSRPATPVSRIRTIPAGRQDAGFLTNYANLKPNADFENTRSYVSQDPLKNLHRYIAVMIEYPVVYVSTNVVAAKIPDRGVAALTDYFGDALNEAVEDAFPVVFSPGPLVLRLRSAIVGVDTGASGDLSIGKVGVEMEFVDSETGQQIAAVVDQQNLGVDAGVGSADFVRQEKFRAAARAFDGWASRLREFLDAAEERSAQDVSRIEDTNFPYNNTPSAPTK